MQSAMYRVGLTPTAYTPCKTRKTNPKAMISTSTSTVCFNRAEYARFIAKYAAKMAGQSQGSRREGLSAMIAWEVDKPKAASKTAVDNAQDTGVAPRAIARSRVLGFSRSRRRSNTSLIM